MRESLYPMLHHPGSGRFSARFYSDSVKDHNKGHILRKSFAPGKRSPSLNPTYESSDALTRAQVTIKGACLTAVFNASFGSLVISSAIMELVS